MRSLILAVLILSASATLNVAHLAAGQVEKPWYQKSYRSMKDGNELYSQCSAAQRGIKLVGDHFLVEGDRTEVIEAGICLGYITAVVDSIPGRDEFDPAPNVKITQYLDVVMKCLKETPEHRNEQAYYLIRICLDEAFPKRR
jgi:hypothetical protein